MTTRESRTSVAVITGASDGIGRSMSLALARRGYALGLIARRRNLLEAVAKQCQEAGAPKVEIAVVDVTDSSALRQALARLEETLGEVDCFVANAGVSGSVTNSTQDGGDDACQVFRVNISAAVVGLEFFKARMAQRGQGLLAGVTSVAGARGLPKTAVYSASKAALTTYLESLRLDMRPRGVRVVDIAPGFVDTEMTRATTHSKPFMIHVDRAGEIFVREMLKGRSRVVAPWPFIPIYWLLRYMPLWAFNWFGTLLTLLKPEGKVTRTR